MPGITRGVERKHKGMGDVGERIAGHGHASAVGEDGGRVQGCAHENKENPGICTVEPQDGEGEQIPRSDESPASRRRDPGSAREHDEQHGDAEEGDCPEREIRQAAQPTAPDPANRQTSGGGESEDQYRTSRTPVLCRTTTRSALS